jgi:GNAT superfamily N-acetyltransferase
MNPELAFTLLATRPQAIRRVAQWWCDEWGLPSRHSSFDEYVHELQALVPGVLPIHILAEQAGSVVGVATLKVKIDHPVIPGQSHWLSGVYVDPPCRNRGIASSLCSEILDAARSRGVEQVYLQTERLDGGLYAKLGWTPLGRHNEEDGVEQVVMVKDLSLVPASPAASKSCTTGLRPRTRVLQAPRPHTVAGRRATMQIAAGSRRSRCCS